MVPQLWRVSESRDPVTALQGSQLAGSAVTNMETKLVAQHRDGATDGAGKGPGKGGAGAKQTREHSVQRTARRSQVVTWGPGRNP